MSDSNGQSYDFLLFLHMSSETERGGKEEIEKQIKERLAQFKLGDYNQVRVDYIRQLKNEVISEVRLASKSKYFHKVKSRFEEMEDFDIEEMTLDFSKKFDSVDKSDLKSMINFSVWFFYLK